MNGELPLASRINCHVGLYEESDEGVYEDEISGVVTEVTINESGEIEANFALRSGGTHDNLLQVAGASTEYAQLHSHDGLANFVIRSYGKNYHPRTHEMTTVGGMCEQKLDEVRLRNVDDAAHLAFSSLKLITRDYRKITRNQTQTEYRVNGTPVTMRFFDA